ncbi:Fc receptor-like protein 5 [Pygocentrus nattereri]|uniref:Fc receptor-like protein 5 n=1 Tax=Pygocentrus nattereri TaxID=42514 RepID=UPI001891998B|nr:Fc receptor-like protein 5 [Pygocentrus nattereri]
MEFRSLSVILLLISFDQVEHSQALYKAVLTVWPKGPQIFSGETVTLRCLIPGQRITAWKYYWFSGDRKLHSSDENYYVIRDINRHHNLKYKCYGYWKLGLRVSTWSNEVTLPVTAEKPKPELTSSHKGAALIGNPVVLYCKLDQSAGWRFYWSKHTQSPETETKTETHSYTISSVSVSDGGQYWCRAGRGNPVYYTHYSDALWINVTGVSPPVSLMVSPSRAEHFITDSLSLSCEGQSDSTGWRVRRYTHSEKVSDCSSGWGSVAGSTCSISSLNTSHTGVYWCESESGESSSPVNITVTNGAVILDSPVHPVTEGDPLTLRCLYRDPKPSNLPAEFYRNGSLLQTQNTGETTIRTVSKSDEGLYHCKHPERGESPQSWISVRAAESAPNHVGVVGVGFAVLFIILLILLCRYRANKGHLANINRMSVQNWRESGAEDSQSGYMREQAGDVHVYDTIQRADADTGSIEVTYADIELKTKKKLKKKQEMISVNADTVYSEVKQNTNEGDVTGLDSTHGFNRKLKNKFQVQEE